MDYLLLQFVFLAFVGLLSLPNAFCLQYATRIAAKFRPNYRQAYYATFAALIFAVGIASFFQLVFPLPKSSILRPVSDLRRFFIVCGRLLAIWLSFTLAFRLIIKSPTGQKLSYLQAGLVSILQLVAFVLVFFLLALPFSKLNPFA